jgi:hypothetical protein
LRFAVFQFFNFQLSECPLSSSLFPLLRPHGFAHLCRSHPRGSIRPTTAGKLWRISDISGDHKHAEIRSDVREAKSKKGGEGCRHKLKGKMINLSIETKVAIAVVTGFVMFIVGAMVQG